MEDDNADTGVLAYAKDNNCIIVTHELPDANIKKNIPIPNVCNAFQIPYKWLDGHKYKCHKKAIEPLKKF